MKKAWIFVLVLGIVFSFAACGNNSKAAAGKWYNDSGRELDVRSDGSWILESLYGSGTWKYLDDKKTIDFTDFYGEVYETEIQKDEWGEYVTLNYYGKFYRGAYPQKQENTTIVAESKIEDVKPDPTEKPMEVITIDPFDGIEYEVSGISPYCEIGINNQNTSEEAQKYLDYVVEEGYFANGDTVNVYAEVNNDLLPEHTEVKLRSDKDTVTVEGQAYYIESTKDIDLSDFIAELDDYIIAKTALTGDFYFLGEDNNDIAINAAYFAEKYGAWGNAYSRFKEIKTVTQDSADLLVLKKKKQDKYINNEVNAYNELAIISRCFSTVLHEGEDPDSYAEGDVYVCFYATNLICYPDGTIRWGSTDPDRFDFDYQATLESIQALRASSVDQYRENYNVTKITGIDFINNN